MPNFRYTARTRLGESRSGTAFAENELHLREVLRNADLFLTRYNLVADSRANATSTLFRARKVRLGDMVEFSRQLATLVRAGIPIIEALGAVQQQTENQALAEAIGEVRVEVLAGSSLAAALKQHPKIFNDLFISLVEAGEAAGVLDQTLEISAEQFDKEALLREQIKAAMTYPKIVVVACFGVVIFMLTFIVPTFAKVYEGFHADLPPMTKLLMLSSDIVFKAWWMVLIGIIVVVFLFKKYRETEKGRLNVDKLTLRIPMVGKIMRKLAIARFTQTWAGATRGGIPILKALAISANTSGNAVIRNAVMQVAMTVQEGSPIAPPLDETGQFPPLVTRMVASGEKSGKLDLMLEEITKFYQRDVDYAVQKMTRLLEPIMTVLVGGIVLFVLLGLYMPVFNLSRVIKR